MADTLHLRVATPEHLFVDEEVSGVELPGKNGYLGVLPGHAPLLSALDPGVLTYASGGGQQKLAIDGGFVEVFEDNVRVLADHAERPADIRVDEARQELQNAEQALKQVHDESESNAALLAIRKAQARIDAAQQGGSTPS
ncbi:MAG: F0F1 ATP synthase subunit epsilon [Acidobacteriaceae bacterium]|nr:F0F1 ATP synthase subunit epsilon [Acidobacteriaceae bacterium]